MDYSVMPDEELLTHYYNGDDLAFADLHRRFLPALVAAAFRRLPQIAGRRDAADEIAAQALVRVALTRESPATRWDSAKGRVRPWLMTILHREATNYLRRGPSARPTSDLSLGNVEDEEKQLQELLMANDLAPLERLTQEELQATLRACIDELPDPLRQVIAMLMDDMRQTDIAEALGVSDPTAMRYRKRAYGLLIECLRRKHVAD